MQLDFRPRWAPPLLVILWVVLLGGGFFCLVRYSLTPGRPGTPPAQWPASSRLTRDPLRPTLVLALHPHCPCSRATATELMQIVSAAHGRLSARVLFVRPSGAPDPWAETPLWRMAKSIPEVTTILDRDGVEAARFHAYTSGQVALYDPAGSLVFSGGITGARGHVGDNQGSRAVIEYARRQALPLRQTPVYGCPLESDDRDSSTKSPSCPAS